MSRIGKQSILIPSGVTVAIKDGAVSVTCQGYCLALLIRGLVFGADNTVTVDVAKRRQKERSLWGTYGAHIKIWWLASRLVSKTA